MNVKKRHNRTNVWWHWSFATNKYLHEFLFLQPILQSVCESHRSITKYSFRLENSCHAVPKIESKIECVCDVYSVLLRMTSGHIDRKVQKNNDKNSGWLVFYLIEASNVKPYIKSTKLITAELKGWDRAQQTPDPFGESQEHQRWRNGNKFVRAHICFRLSWRHINIAAYQTNCTF